MAFKPINIQQMLISLSSERSLHISINNTGQELKGCAEVMEPCSVLDQ